MNSLWGESTQYFFQLSPDKILSAVDMLGEKTTGRALSLMSLENRVYQIEVEREQVQSPSDRFLVAKFYRPGRWTAEQIQEEHDFLLELFHLEIPVIAPILYQGKSLFLWPEGNIFYALFPKRGGRSLHELSEAQNLRLARTLGRIHSVGATKKFKTRLKLDATTYLKSNLEFLLSSQFIPESLRASYESCVLKIFAQANTFLPTLPYQRIHGDCHHGNILWNDDSPLFLDFDDTVMGPCVQDFWPLSQVFDDPQKRAEFIAAYETFHPFNAKHLNFIPLLRALRIVHYSAWIARRYDDPSFSQIFTHVKEENYWQREIFFLQELYGEFINVVNQSAY